MCCLYVWMDEGDFTFHSFLFLTNSRVPVNYLCGHLSYKDGTEGTNWVHKCYQKTFRW